MGVRLSGGWKTFLKNNDRLNASSKVYLNLILFVYHQNQQSV
jgi:hypothetical protein